MSSLSERRKRQQEVMDWYQKMFDCVATLTEDELATFTHWNKERMEGAATSDWPGFDKYLPPRPWKDK
jgi:hypothetical protein